MSPEINVTSRVSRSSLANSHSGFPALCLSKRGGNLGLLPLCGVRSKLNFRRAWQDSLELSRATVGT